MGRARRLYASARRRGLAAALTIAALAVAGCGSSGSSGTGSTDEAVPGQRPPAGATVHGCAVSVHGVAALRSAGATCVTAAEVAASWAAERGCTPVARASRSACTVGSYRCLATSTERGLAVGCARPGRSISFLARRG